MVQAGNQISYTLFSGSVRYCTTMAWLDQQKIDQSKTLNLHMDNTGCKIFIAFVKDNATMSSIRYFENHVSYFVQNQRSRPY